ncbi:hypothetical protein [Paenibacillus marinisediminis]
MGKRLMLVVLMTCVALTVISPAMAQTRASGETLFKGDLNKQVGQLNMDIDMIDSLKMKQYLVSVRDQANELLSSPTTQEDSSNTRKKLNYALKLANDFKTVGSKLWTNSPFVVYNVPAVSPIKRLPDLLPEDGAISDQLSVISAQGEFEAASFVLAPLGDVNAVTFTVSDLTGEKSTIPANAVDLHVVKTWYQGGTAWQSYFADSAKSVLVPELLLHDENLIKVDHARKGNSLRIDYPDGAKYVDISNIPATKFNTYNEPVADSPILLPITLKQGESKQMWLTSHVPSDTPAGTYTGTIDILADGISAGQITLKIRVLPFELPKPKTYYDLNKDFYVMLYHQSRVKENLKTANGNMKLVETKLLNDYRNLVDHNVLNIPGPLYSIEDKAAFTKQIDLMQQAGLSLNPLFGVRQTFAPYHIFTTYTGYLSAKAAYEANPTQENKLKMDKLYTDWRKGIDDHKASLDEAIDFVSNYVGHTNLYFDGWDEPGWSMLQYEQELWKYIQDKGFKVFSTGNESHYRLDVKENFLNIVGEPTREKAETWHSFGDDKIITNYAYPHTGPENPDLMRQRHGMWVYKANYDATYNYIFYEGPPNIWNDNSIQDEFRNFNLVYPTQTDLIDTIAWEGYREGIDDIRYATKLKQLAADAIASGQQERANAANNALTWLEEVDERSTNQDLLRLEMIRHILHMIDLEKKTQ